MGNSINNQFKMRRHGGAVERATETSPTTYSVNQEKTMANMGMVDSAMNMGHAPTNMGHAPTNYGTPIKNTDPKKKENSSTVEIGKGASNKLNEIVMYGQKKNRYKPSEVGGEDAYTRKKYVPKPGKPIV